MLTSRPWRLRLALLSACSFALGFASLATGQARANDCAMNNVFQMGVNNTCNASTFLQGGAATGLLVSSTAQSAVVISGIASALFGDSWGVLGRTDSNGASARGVYGYLNNSSPGVSSAAVYGLSLSTTANGPAVSGFHLNGAGSAPAVLGHTNSTAANAAGVSGTIRSHADYSGGVRGENFDAACCGFGVVGFHAGQGIGVGGYAPNGFGVFGWSPNNWAAWLDGAVTITKDLHVNGTLYASAKNFRIDDPLDPAHKYLQHASVESNQLTDVYSGNATTNRKGFATVKLPSWFQALNRDFRYQLTPIGHNAWGARAVVWNEIKDNRFTIRSEPHVKISWQVTGVRHDPYANAHRLQVVAPKTGSEAGKYAHPELYGQPASKGVTALPPGLKYSKQAAAAPNLNTK